MEQRKKFPICISSSTNFDENKEKHQKYINTYEWSDNGCLQYVTGIIRNEMGDILVGFNKKHWVRQIPSWKIDKGESHQTSLEREIQEETNLQAKESAYIWTSKVILNRMVWQWHFYETKVKWVLEAKEADTMEIFKRVNFVKTNTRLWFWITDGKETISNPTEILQYWHMFAEIFWTINFPSYREVMKKDIIMPNNLDKEESYIQYRDIEKGNLEISKYKDFLEVIEI